MWRSAPALSLGTASRVGDRRKWSSCWDSLPGWRSALESGAIALALSKSRFTLKLRRFAFVSHTYISSKGFVGKKLRSQDMVYVLLGPTRQDIISPQVIQETWTRWCSVGLQILGRETPWSSKVFSPKPMGSTGWLSRTLFSTPPGCCWDRSYPSVLLCTPTSPRREAAKPRVESLTFEGHAVLGGGRDSVFKFRSHTNALLTSGSLLSFLSSCLLLTHVAQSVGWQRGLFSLLLS